MASARLTEAAAIGRRPRPCDVADLAISAAADPGRVAELLDVHRGPA
jgi:hypothetical protein